MKLALFAALVPLTLASNAALAAPITLDFESPASFSSIAGFYNGGADGAGTVGPALGATFGGDALALQNDALGPYFSNAPSPIGVMTPVGNDATLNVAGGLNGSFSFFYSASSLVASGVQIWTGLDGTGGILASFNLAANATLGCTSSAFCHFDQMSSTFFGTAQSITFGNAANLAVFDNVSFTPATVTAVPEPTTWALLAIGLGGVALARRRARPAA